MSAVSQTVWRRAVRKRLVVVVEVERLTVQLSTAVRARLALVASHNPVLLVVTVAVEGAVIMAVVVEGLLMAVSPRVLVGHHMCRVARAVTP
jgi:hypothetical protein